MESELSLILPLGYCCTPPFHRQEAPPTSLPPSACSDSAFDCGGGLSPTLFFPPVFSFPASSPSLFSFYSGKGMLDDGF